MKQVAYARRAWGAKQQSKKQIALDVGYAPSVANSVVSKIESKPGFNNAMAKLAADSNHIALSVMYEIKARGFTDYTNKDLVSALNAIAGAWDRFNKGLIEQSKPEDNGRNRLKTVILQNISKQVNAPSVEGTEIISPQKEAISVEYTDVPPSPPPLDF